MLVVLDILRYLTKTNGYRLQNLAATFKITSTAPLQVGWSIIQFFSRNQLQTSLKVSLLYTNYPAKDGY